MFDRGQLSTPEATLIDVLFIACIPDHCIFLVNSLQNNVPMGSFRAELDGLLLPLSLALLASFQPSNPTPETVSCE